MIRNIPALLRYLAQREAMPFAYWQNDCVTSAAGAVKAQGGPDVLAGMDPWTDEAEAIARLQEVGGIEAAVDRHLQRLTAPAFAMRGDIGLVPLADGKAFLAVVEGQMIVGPGLHRARRVPRSAMTVAWSAL